MYRTQEPADDRILQMYEAYWHCVEPGLYYGLKRCDSIPQHAAGMIPERALSVAFEEFLLSFHTLPIDYERKPSPQPWFLGFPLIELTEEGICEHRVTLRAWTLFVKDWLRYKETIDSGTASIPAIGLVNVDTRYAALHPTFPGLNHSELYINSPY